jgi:hypothetical protein
VGKDNRAGLTFEKPKTKKPKAHNYSFAAVNQRHPPLIPPYSKGGKVPRGIIFFHEFSEADMGNVARFRLKMILVLIGLMGVTAVRAEIPRLPFEIFASGGLPVTMYQRTPDARSWLASFAIQGGIESELQRLWSVRLDYAYHQFRYRKYYPVDSNPVFPRPRQFHTLICDQIVSFTERSSNLRPYVFLGFGAVWGGNVIDDHVRTDCGDETESYSDFAGRGGVGFAARLGSRWNGFVEGSYVTALSNSGYYYIVSFVPIRFGLSFR